MSKGVTNAVGLESTQRSYNWEFVAHAIKDVLDPKEGVVVYGKNFALLPVLRSPLFSIEAWGLAPFDRNYGDNVFYWNVIYSNARFGNDWCNTFISIGFNDLRTEHEQDLIALHMLFLMKPGGKLLIVDQQGWADKFNSVFEERIDLAKEIKSYHMFSDKNVKVYSK